MKPLGKLLFIAFLYAINCANGYGQTTVANQQIIPVPITSTGTTENALLSLPNDYSSTTTSYPLLIFLHGVGEAGSDLSKIYNSTNSGGPAYFIGKGTFPTSFTNPADGKVYKFIVLSPQAPSYSTSAPQLDYVIKSMIQNYRVDVNRIYLTGLSAGGEGIVNYTTHTNVTPTNLAAAMVPMSAAISTPTQTWGNTIAGDNVHVWGLGSYAQDIFGENTSRLVDAINVAKPGLARFTNYSGGHCCWNTYYNPSYKETINGVSMNIYEWMLQFTRSTTTTPPPPPPTNQSPVANAGTGQTITLPTNSAALNGGASSDPDGSISSYSWSKTAGPSTYTIANPTAVSTNVSGLVQGTYDFTLTVTDNGGATSSATVQIVVNGAANIAPTSNAGPDQTINLPQDSVTLNGSASSDPDGSIVKYEWNTVSGTSAPATPHAKPGGRAFTLKPDAQGYLVVDNSGGTYRGGDTLYLNGYFKSVAILNMSGASDNYITVTNLPGQTLIIGDSLWTGGAWAQGLVFRGCHYVEVAGSSKSNFKVIGCNTNATDASGNPVKTAYFDLAISEMSDNFVVHDLIIRHGGAGLWAKTEISPTKSNTWYPNTFLNNFEFYNLDIFNTYNEGMYIGHTATYWNINTNTPYYPKPTDPTPDPSIYKRPIKLTNVKIHDNYIHDIGNDGMQTAAIDGLEVYNNEVYNWAIKRSSADNGGILIGGRVKGFNVHDNYVHDSWGELMQVYAEGGATATIQNNLLVRNQSDGISMRGTDGLYVNFLNNTVAYTGENAVRINGYFGQTGTNIINKNLIIHPKNNGGTILTNSYIYTENGALAQEGTSPNDNKKYASDAGMQIDELNYFLPALTSPATTYGYIKGGSVNGVHTIVSPNSPVTVVRGLKEGTYVFRLTVTDNSGATAQDDVTVIVKPAAPPNKVPTASAGGDQTITLPTNSVSLSGSGADADGSVSSYGWAKISGPTQFTITTPGTASTSVTNLVQGVYQFELTVTDDKGATGKDTVQITVNSPGNQTPVANAGLDQIISLPTNNVMLNGSATDVDGTISSYGWAKISGPTQFTITTPGAASTTVTNLAQGVYQFELTVTDDKGATGKDTVQITVNAPSNQIPVVDAGIDLAITLPTNSVTLNGSATDADGTISNLTWTKISGPAQFTIGSPNTASTSITNLVTGVYQFELQATDDKGAVAKDTVNVAVKDATATNQAPSVYPGADQTITLPVNSVTLTASGTDPDGIISAYNWTYVSGPSQYTIVNANSASTAVNNLVEGTYQFRVIVTDDDGATASNVINITVIKAVNQAPAVYPGADQTITLPTNSVTLVASAQDPDGTVVYYNWTYASGPSQYTIVSPNNATTVINNLVEGTYQFRILVTDNSGASASNVINITVVKIPNKAPSAYAGVDQSITLPLNSVTLNGSGTDPDGTISSYKWTYVSGPSQYTIVNANSASTAINNLVVGTYQFRLTVTDNEGATASSVVNITVIKAPNQAPAVYAGGDQTITLPVNSVKLTASASDPDGTISSYKWTYVSGPSQYTIASPNAAITDITNLVAGTYQFRILVTDNDGASASNVVNVIVNPAANVAPTANAGTGQTITLPINSVMLNGSGSDVDGTITSYSWTYVSGPSQYFIVSPNNASSEIRNLVAGTYVFRLTVTDNRGATASATVTITVNPGVNVAPTANAGGAQTITLPVNSVTLNGSGSDADGSIANYSWTYVSGPSQYFIVSPNNASTDIKNLVAGTYVFRLTVTDDRGGTGSATVTITVNPGNQAPTANAGSDQTITLPVNSVTLTGSGSDADGSIANYSWTYVSGPSQYTIVSSGSASTDIKNLVAGTYIFKLTVTDDKGATASANVTIIVNPAPNKPPVANAGTDMNVNPAAVIKLDGTGSYDPDGQITGYNWQKISGPSPFTMTGFTTATPSLLGALPGTYLFRLTVTDDQGATATDEVQVVIIGGNRPPIANAGADTTIVSPASNMTLNGAKSKDDDGSIVSYNWKQIAGPSQAAVTGASSMYATVSNLGLGKYQFELVVTDNEGAIGKDTITINIQNYHSNHEVVMIYPNPVGNTLNYTLYSEKDEQVGISILDMGGRVVKRSTKNVVTGANNGSLDVHDMSQQGIYVFEVYFRDGARKAIKFMKK
jgi:predicted esterase